MSDNWEKRARAAETTADVLKRKVKALYNGESKSVLQRQVERATLRQEDARRRRELLEVKAAELAKYSRGLEVEVAERTRVLRTILDNVTSGFLVVNEELVVAPGYTRSCHEILKTSQISGRRLVQVLCGHDARLGAQLEMALIQVFADILPEEVTLDAIPRRFPVGDTAIRVDARAIRADDGAVQEILLTLSDITSLELAQREARENKVLIGILRQRESFRGFVADARELMAAAREAIAERDPDFYRRALHTVKGNAAAFELHAVAETIHAVEAHDEITSADVDAVETELRGFLARHVGVLDLPYDGTVDASFEVTEKAVDALSRITRPNDIEVRRWTAELVLKRAETVLGPLGSYVEKLAERLEKQVEFVMVGGDVKLDARKVRPVVRTLAHLLRNALDHGIESPDDRGEKPTTGRVEVRVEECATEWTIHVTDDGRGIDTDALAAESVRRGLLTADDAASMSTAEKRNLIFMDGLSTAAAASDVSGRGVGMAAVKAAVEAEGGEMDVSSTRGEGTQFVIHIPKPEELTVRTSLRPVRSTPPAQLSGRFA
jgi:two-component system chemotaxis sensor kinase CheA